MALPLEGPADLDPLLERIGDARYVLLGEASHGTSEYYPWRDRISRRLIREKGFSFIAVEGDWPDCYRVNRYVKGLPDSGTDAREVLHAFERWPTWMWANEEVVDLAEWLRRHNDGLPGRPEGRLLRAGRVQPVGLALRGHGLSPQASTRRRCRRPGAPSAASSPTARTCRSTPGPRRWCRPPARTRWSPCSRSCAGKEPRYADDGREAYFAAEQNALVVKNAEAYYRAMVRGGPESWNIRDRHMTETLERLMRHHGPGAKAIVWEHNTHIGDARFTDMADDGMVNVGQLVRERHADEGVVLVGFGSYRGSVIAGREWEAPMERMAVPPAREGSWEDVLHRAGAEDKLLLLDDVRRRRRLPRGARPPRHRRGVPPRVRAIRQLRADRAAPPLRRLLLHRRDPRPAPAPPATGPRRRCPRRIPGECRRGAMRTERRR